MRAVAIIKSYQHVVEQKTQLPYDDDRAMTDFRAFWPIAQVHSAKVCDVNALEVMLEVVERVRGELLARKSVLLS